MSNGALGRVWAECYNARIMLEAIAAVLRAVLAPFTWLWNRLRFDGISVGFPPATTGAFGLYSDAVRGFNIQIKVANVTSRPVAIEGVDALLVFEPKPGAPQVHGARGACEPFIATGVFDESPRADSFPIVVSGSGGELHVKLDTSMGMRYQRRFLHFFWKYLDGLGIDDPTAPTDPDGERMYQDYFNLKSLHLMFRVNGKIRRKPANIWRLR